MDEQMMAYQAGSEIPGLGVNPAKIIVVDLVFNAALPSPQDLGLEALVQGEKSSVQGEKSLVQGEKSSVQGEKSLVQGEKPLVQNEEALVQAGEAWAQVLQEKVEGLLTFAKEAYFQKLGKEERGFKEATGDLTLSIDLSFCNPEEMQSYNKTYRGVDRPTDVLSFPALPLSEGKLTRPLEDADYLLDEEGNYASVSLGSILLCTPILLDQARDFQHSGWEEMAYLVIHSFLHLLGYDHGHDPAGAPTTEEAKRMFALQEAIWSAYEKRSVGAGTAAECAPCQDSSVSREEASAPCQDSSVRSGIIALCGQTNRGKSTLLNALCESSIAIISNKVNTTRDIIRGVRDEEGYQMVFVDAPGIHDRENLLDRYMQKAASLALSEADIYVCLVEPRDERPGKVEQIIASRAKKKGCPLILLINKVDQLEDKTQLLPIIQAYASAIDYDEIIPISALHQDGLKDLLQVLRDHLPRRGLLVSDGSFTDQSERNLVQELIRSCVYEQMSQELPFATAVQIQRLKERETPRTLNDADFPADRTFTIEARIVCENDRQKGMLIGKKGARIKAIGMASRKKIHYYLDVFPELYLDVEVLPNWRENEGFLQELGYWDIQSKSLWT